VLDLTQKMGLYDWKFYRNISPRYRVMFLLILI